MEGVQHAIKTAYEQQRIAADVLGGRDGLVCLPTGYGKSLCYAILPWAFDELSRMRKDDKHSIVLVVSPLVSFSRVHTYPSVCELKKTRDSRDLHAKVHYLLLS